jgi:hypothetical protein
MYEFEHRKNSPLAKRISRGMAAPRFVQFYFDISPEYESGCRFQVGDIVVQPILGGLDHRYARI